MTPPSRQPQASSIRDRVWGYVVGFGLTLLTLAPGLGPLERDSFPLSTYPMFSTKRDKPWVHVAVGVDASGGERRLGPQVVVGTHEVMQSAQTIRKAVRGGGARRRELCQDIAQRVASDPSLGDLVTIEIRSLRYDAVLYFDHDPPVPLRTKRRAHCPVPHGAVEEGV